MKPAPPARLKLAVQGAVQGVGFRPFVYRLASEYQLTGWVSNSPQGVCIEAEGPRPELEEFLRRLKIEKPALSSIQGLESSWLDAAGYRGFEILKSETAGNKTTLVLPDIATCPDCLREIFDPASRRYLYPFTNCTHCGPRFSIVESLPYDRANTSMKNFAMCPECQEEYDDPTNRRFHAQPNACPRCGPHLELWEKSSRTPDKVSALTHGHIALLVAAKAILRGQIVAVKGIGGFHLMTNARNEEAVARLRTRKNREEKPFALLFPSLDSLRTVCEISKLEEQILLSPAAPIVLVRKKPDSGLQIANSVAPGNPNWGVMLPSNPIQSLLMAELDSPVVATSGNLCDEPICIEEHQALERLHGIADLFLIHNRPIVRHVDDSIVRVIHNREMILRRARGYAPLPVPLLESDGNGKQENAETEQKITLATGSHLKNSVALAVGRQVFISQHIGDLETEPANNAFRRVIVDFKKLYQAKPDVVVADLHPDYLSTQFAGQMAAKQLRIQHHVAHVLSCMADNAIASPVLGVAWDGTGYGPDGMIWGGEFFLVKGQKVRRIAHLRPFPLPGGNAAIKEPRRSAIGLLHEFLGAAAFELQHLPVFQKLSPVELRAAKKIMELRLHSPLTTSVGRLFDAVAALTGLRQKTSCEGQAAMDLEFAIGKMASGDAYPMAISAPRPPIQLNWQPMIEGILADINYGVSVSQISAKFHNTLVEGIVEIAKLSGETRIVLSGGCFQNRYLLERTITRLRQENLLPFWHRQVPPNDGGIALGQIMAARQEITLLNPETNTGNVFTPKL